MPSALYSLLALLLLAITSPLARSSSASFAEPSRSTSLLLFIPTSSDLIHGFATWTVLDDHTIRLSTRLFGNTNGMRLCIASTSSTRLLRSDCKHSLPHPPFTDTEVDVQGGLIHLQESKFVVLGLWKGLKLVSAAIAESPDLAMTNTFSGWQTISSTGNPLLLYGRLGLGGDGSRGVMEADVLTLSEDGSDYNISSVTVFHDDMETSCSAEGSHFLCGLASTELRDGPALAFSLEYVDGETLADREEMELAVLLPLEHMSLAASALSYTSENSFLSPVPPPDPLPPFARPTDTRDGWSLVHLGGTDKRTLQEGWRAFIFVPFTESLPCTYNDSLRLVWLVDPKWNDRIVNVSLIVPSEVETEEPLVTTFDLGDSSPVVMAHGRLDPSLTLHPTLCFSGVVPSNASAQLYSEVLDLDDLGAQIRITWLGEADHSPSSSLGEGEVSVLRPESQALLTSEGLLQKGESSLQFR